MLKKLTRFHPGLVGVILGCGTGVLYSMYWFGLNPAGPGLNETETVWLLIVTGIVLYCLPLSTVYFSYYAYPGLKYDPLRSATRSWKTIFLIVFPLSVSYVLTLEILFTHPDSISTAAMFSIFSCYAAVMLVLLYVCYQLPWVNQGRLALQKPVLANAADSPEPTYPNATTTDPGTQFRYQRRLPGNQKEP